MNHNQSLSRLFHKQGLTLVSKDSNIVVDQVVVTTLDQHTELDARPIRDSNDSLPELSHPEHSPALRECSTLRGAK